MATGVIASNRHMEVTAVKGLINDTIMAVKVTKDQICSGTLSKIKCY